MLKRIFCLLLCLVLMLSLLTACGGETVAEPEATEAVEENLYLDKKHFLIMDIERSIAAENYALLTANAPDVSQQREQIINSKTNILKSDSFVQGETYTGTAYYVSNSGSDYNSGLSPEEAWASLDRVNNTKFQRGDAVFFERGGVWYGNIRPTADDLTLSAYGDGAKPIISGNEPEATNPERWREYGKTPDGGTVWVFENALTDSAQIFLGEEKQPALRICPDVKDGIFVNEVGKEFETLEELTQDLSFFCNSDITSLDITQSLTDRARETDIYLRCDTGNPAELFGQIEFMYSLMGVWNEYCGLVIDNLNIKNFGSVAVSGGMARAYDSHEEEYELAPSVLVQNCEISYCGGCISQYDNGFGRLKPAYSGGALQLSGNGNRAVNNYIHDVNSKVFVVVHIGQFDVQGPGYEGIEIRGNLLENNCRALHLTDYSYVKTGSEESCYFEVDFIGNTVLYSGYGWFTEQNRGRRDYRENFDNCALEIRGTPNEKDDINISDNIFYGAEMMLVSNVSGRSSGEPGGLEYKDAKFSGNTYAQHGNLGRIIEDVYNGTDIEKFAKEILGDETGKAYVLE